MPIQRVCFTVTVALALAAPAVWGLMADPDQQTWQLGAIEVKGEKNILQTLQGIKAALKRPFSVDPADANVVVCRLDKKLGEEGEYLTCATNRDYTQQRDATHLALFVSSGQGKGSQCSAKCSAIISLENLVAAAPASRLYMRVDGHAFRKLMDGIPMPEAATVAAPASASQPSGN